MRGTVLRALFVAYLAATALHVGWVAAHEPFSFDAWNVAHDTHAEPITTGRFFGYWWLEYTQSNPRLGQPFAYLGYKLEGFTPLASPLAVLAIALAIAVLGLGRVPRWRRGRDLAWWAFATGALWFALPELGKTLFCRAYAANYLYTLAIQLWFLVPLRLMARASGRAACALYAAFGVAAGLCNEHTGPTLCAFVLGLAWWQRRRRAPAAPLALCGGIGAAIGFAALFFAPGQGERYNGLAQRVSLLGRVIQHGVAGNFDIVRGLLVGLAPVLALAAITGGFALADREAAPELRDARAAAVRRFGGVLVAALVMAATLFVSPKLGTRFYLGSCALALAAFTGLADLVVGRRGLAWLVTLAAAASIYAAAHTVPLYHRAARASDARMAALAAAPPGSTFVAAGFDQVDESWWFYGDDFRDQRKRDMVATYFGLGGIVFHAYDPEAPLGVTGVQLVPVATLDPPGCLDQGLAIGAVKGFDVAGLQQQSAAAIGFLRERIAPRTLVAVTVLAQLADPHPPMPGKRVVVAKWWPDRFEAYAGAIQRAGLSATRTIALPKDLAGTDAEIYVYRVGGESRRIGSARGEPLHYVPWASGVYWILACRGDDCFVIAATRQGG